MKKGNQSPSGGGWRIAPFGKGKSPLLSANHADSIKALNALGRITIIRDEVATSDKVLYGSENVVIKIAGAASIGTVGQSSLTTYRVKSKSGDVLFCKSWDGTSEGVETVEVAVNRNSRQLSSETVSGTTYTYSSYAAVDSYNNSRTSNDGSTSQTQIVTPMWYVDCEIDVMSTDYSGVLYDNTVDEPYDLKLIEVSARCWAKVA